MLYCLYEHNQCLTVVVSSLTACFYILDTSRQGVSKPRFITVVVDSCCRGPGEMLTSS